MSVQVKALEAAEAARRKEAAKAAEKAKQKDQVEKQKAERLRYAQATKVGLHGGPDAGAQRLPLHVGLVAQSY